MDYLRRLADRLKFENDPKYREDKIRSRERYIKEDPWENVKAELERGEYVLDPRFNAYVDRIYIDKLELKDIAVEAQDCLILPEELAGDSKSLPSIPVFYDDVKILAKERGVELKKNEEEIDSDIIAEWSESIMREIVNELVKNAIEETPPGGSVTVSLEQERDKAVLSVSDTGRGISEENLAKIFEKGFTMKPTGTGQGLALVKSYVENVLHGKVEVKSEVGKGTEFRLIFPLFKEDNGNR